jgi:hypothetical protein
LCGTSDLRRSHRRRRFSPRMTRRNTSEKSPIELQQVANTFACQRNTSQSRSPLMLLFPDRAVLFVAMVTLTLGLLPVNSFDLLTRWSISARSPGS